MAIKICNTLAEKKEYYYCVIIKFSEFLKQEINEIDIFNIHAFCQIWQNYQVID